MASQAAASLEANSRAQRYRRVEQALWDHYGLAATEHFVQLDQPPVRLRVVEIGSGDPVMFVHGTPGMGPYWGPLLQCLPGFRALLLDRPGWGLSEPLDYSRHRYPSVTADVMRGVMDGLGLRRAAVVGHSIGNVWALRIALAEPQRITAVGLMGGGPIVDEIAPPSFIRLLASPIGAIITRFPQSRGLIEKMLRESGHGPSLEAGRVPDAFFEWRTALSRHTASMRHERDMVKVLLGRNGWRPGLTFSADELASVQQPVAWALGSADVVGSVELWTRAARQMAQAELRVIEGTGHLPWLDAPDQVAGELRRAFSHG